MAVVLPRIPIRNRPQTDLNDIILPRAVGLCSESRAFDSNRVTSFFFFAAAVPPLSSVRFFFSFFDEMLPPFFSEAIPALLALHSHRRVIYCRDLVFDPRSQVEERQELEPMRLQSGKQGPAQRAFVESRSLSLSLSFFFFPFSSRLQTSTPPFFFLLPKKKNPPQQNSRRARRRCATTEKSS